MTIKQMRMQVTLDVDQHRRAAAKAEAMGISLAEYVRRVIAADLDEEGSDSGDISDIFGIGESSGSDVARHKHRELGEAVAAGVGGAQQSAGAAGAPRGGDGEP
jgi:hypothetical protein